MAVEAADTKPKRLSIDHPVRDPPAPAANSTNALTQCGVGVGRFSGVVALADRTATTGVAAFVVVRWFGAVGRFPDPPATSSAEGQSAALDAGEHFQSGGRCRRLIRRDNPAPFRAPRVRHLHQGALPLRRRHYACGTSWRKALKKLSSVGLGGITPNLPAPGCSAASAPAFAGRCRWTFATPGRRHARRQRWRSR